MTALTTGHAPAISPDFLSLELTSRCQFVCPSQCYTEAATRPATTAA